MIREIPSAKCGDALNEYVTATNVSLVIGTLAGTTRAFGCACEQLQAERVYLVAMTQDTQRTAVVAICDSRSSAEAAIVALHHEGLDMKRLSIGDKTSSTTQHILDSVKDGEFLVLIRGTAEMVVHARAVLGTSDSSRFRTRAESSSSRLAAGIGTGQ